jgi:hypothetical protein
MQAAAADTEDDREHLVPEEVAVVAERVGGAGSPELISTGAPGPGRRRFMSRHISMIICPELGFRR